MPGALIFLNLAGAVALLLWATHMVRSGVERAYGAGLDARLRRAFPDALRAIGAGGVMAMALQSATAVALIVAGFAASGHVAAARGIAAVVGADLGSAVVTGILRLDLSLLVPVLLLLGVIAFRSSAEARWRQVGRILIGIGLLLLSLRLIGEASEPLRDGEVLPLVLGYLSRDWLTAFLLAALMTWLFHSSIAAILLVATLADRGVIPPVLVIPLVLGINFGAALIAVYLGRGMARAGLVVLLANLALRGVGALAVFALHLMMPLDALMAGMAPGDAVVMGHVAFNALVALGGLLLAPAATRALEALMPPGGRRGISRSRETALKEADLALPARALANATRELLALCERVELMLSEVFRLYRRPEREALAALSSLDDEVDAMHSAIKLHLARLDEGALDPETRARRDEILSANIRLEQIADIIAQGIAAKARKKLKRGVDFSDAGWEELSGIHAEVQRNARLAFNVLMTGDVDTARDLAESKETIRRLEQESEESHHERLRAGITASRETSALHVDTIRDLKEINSLLVALTYPVLQREGMLRQTRLR